MTPRFIPEIPALYEVAKQITLDAGMDYRHPVTGEVTKAPRKKAKKRKVKK